MGREGAGVKVAQPSETSAYATNLYDCYVTHSNSINRLFVCVMAESCCNRTQDLKNIEQWDEKYSKEGIEKIKRNK